MPIGNTLDWASVSDVKQALYDVLQKLEINEDSDDAGRLIRNVEQGMAVASDDIRGYLCGGRGYTMAILGSWANKEAVFIDQSIYRTFERCAALSMPTQDKKPSMFDHREQFKDKAWSPTNAAGEIISNDITDEDDGDGIEGPDGRGNSTVFMGRLSQERWNPTRDTRY